MIQGIASVTLTTDIIKQSEGFKPTVYRDVAGLWTIGYGFRFWNGRAVTASYPGTITQAQADHQLDLNVEVLVGQLDKILTVQLNDNQMSAVVSLVYNIGFSSFQKSTMLKYLNNNEINKASDQFLVWCHSNGRIIKGLLARRLNEKKLFDG